MQKKRGQAKNKLMLKLTADRILSGKGNKNAEKALKHQFMHNMVQVENSLDGEIVPENSGVDTQKEEPNSPSKDS